MAGGSGSGGNLLEALRAAADPDDPFLLEPGGAAHTYGQIFDRAGRLAAALAEAGAEPGDRVLVQVDKSPTAVALYLACLHAGVVHVPLNPAFTATEVAYFVEDAEPAVVVDPATLDRLIERADALDPAPVAARAEDDLAALLYTSGTTGRPKGAALTHANLRHNARALHETWQFTGDDHLLHTLPLFHVHGLFVALHCAMLAGVAVTFLRRFDVDAVLDGLVDATVLMGVPTHYSRLLADPRFDRASTAHVRLFTCGSAPLTPVAFEAVTARTGHRICERYGMSEAGIITSNPVDGERVAGTVGFPLPGVELRVVDRDGRPTAPDTVGSVEIRGPHLFAGYWRRPDATGAAFRPDGFFVTGDIGSLDPEGRLSLQGRAGDLVISGGENVYPREIELVLDTVDGIVESAVVGLPHPDLGEAVTAVVVTAPDYAEARARAALDTTLARFKHPKAFIEVDALPRNAMGKVQKHRLREAHANRYAD